MLRLAAPLCLLLGTAALAGGSDALAPEQVEFFEKRVRPIFGNLMISRALGAACANQHETRVQMLRLARNFRESAYISQTRGRLRESAGSTQYPVRSAEYGVLRAWGRLFAARPMRA